MAQKQYSFDFILNAVLNGGFSGTFTKAQQEFIRLGAEIKHLQEIQRDVKAYEKQAAAVQNTSQKLENLKRQYELVNRQIGETTGSTTALEREKLKLEQRISNTEAALEKQKQKLGETKDRLDAAGVSTTDLANKDAELAAKIQELTEEQKKAAEGAGEFGNAGVQAIEAVGGAIAAAGIADAMKGIADAYKECVGVAGNFEQAMSAVEAIADSSVSEMSALTSEAKELGATTKFTAQQSANAMEYMAMAGWDAQEMLGGMSGVINLAAAAGEDLAQVSDIVTDNLSAFGLKASDTAHFADVLAAAAANSNTNISIMGETFKSSSSVAGALGYSIEDVAVMVGLMANNAVKGSRAGTALRNIFNGLLGGITLTARAFGDLDYSAVNYDGTMKGLMETAEDLRGYFDQMTESEKVMNAQNIAGMRGYNGLLAILNATDEDFQSLYQSVTDCTGAAQRMASVKLDNLNGDITLANSAMEALQSTIGEQFNPELRALTQLKTELLNEVNQFIQDAPTLAKVVMAGAAAFAAVGTAVVGVNAALKIFNMLSAAGLFTTPVGNLLALAAGIAGVTAAVVGFVDATRDGGPAVRELTGAARELNATMEEAKASYEDTAVEMTATANTADFLIGKLEEIEEAEGDNAAQSQEYQNTLALLLRTMPELSNCISQTTDEYGRSTYILETDTEALRANTEEWKKNAQAKAYQDYLNSLYDQYGAVLQESAENEIGLTMSRYELEQSTQDLADTQKRMSELWDEAERKAEEQYQQTGLLSDATGFLTQEYYDLEEQSQKLSNQITEANDSIKIHEKAIERDADAVEEAEAKMSVLEKTIQKVKEAMGLDTDGEENLSAEQQAIQNVLDGTITKVDELTNAYAEAYKEAAESFSGQFGLFDEAEADAEATVEAAQAALDSQLAYWQEYGRNIEALKNLSADDLHTTEENYNALMALVRTGTPEAAALAADMVKEWNDGNTQVLTNLADTLGEVKEEQDQAAQDVADWTTGLQDQMDQFINDMKTEIGELDASEEASESARKTVQAFIDKAGTMTPNVRNAYAQLARAAANALDMPLNPARYGDSRGTNKFKAYASGTSNAPPGWSWVGEEGPELMRMHGGEQILPNSVSRQVAEDYSEYQRYTAKDVPPEFSKAVSQEQTATERYSAYSRYTGDQDIQQESRPLEVIGTGGTGTGTAKVEMHFHIEAGALPETVDAWQDYANRGELKAVVLEVMEEADADIKRRVMG